MPIRNKSRALRKKIPKREQNQHSIFLLRTNSAADNPKSGGAEGVKGAIADFVRFHCPLVASAEAKSPAHKWLVSHHQEKQTYSE